MIQTRVTKIAELIKHLKLCLEMLLSFLFLEIYHWKAQLESLSNDSKLIAITFF